MSLCPRGQGAQPHVMTVAGITQTYGTAQGAAARDPEALRSAHPLLPSTALNTPARATTARGSCGWVPGAWPRLYSLQTAPNKPGSASKQDPAGSWKSNRRSQAGERVAPSPREAPGRRRGPPGPQPSPAAHPRVPESREVHPGEGPNLPSHSSQAGGQARPQLHTQSAPGVLGASSIPTLSPIFPWHKALARTKVHARQHLYLPCSREPSWLNPATASTPAGTKTRDPDPSRSSSWESSSPTSPPVLSQGMQQGAAPQDQCFQHSDPTQNPAKTQHSLHASRPRSGGRHQGWETCQGSASCGRQLPKPPWASPARSGLLFPVCQRNWGAGGCASEQPSPVRWQRHVPGGVCCSLVAALLVYPGRSPALWGLCARRKRGGRCPGRPRAALPLLTAPFSGRLPFLLAELPGRKPPCWVSVQQPLQLARLSTAGAKQLSEHLTPKAPSGVLPLPPCWGYTAPGIPPCPSRDWEHDWG